MKNIKIEIPEGMVIDTEKSDLTKGIVVFKKEKKGLRWEDLVQFYGFWITDDSKIEEDFYSGTESISHYKRLFPARKDAESALALAQLLQVRKAMIGDWEPDWSNNEEKYAIARIDDQVSWNIRNKEYGELSFPSEEMVWDFMEANMYLLKIYFKL